MATQHLVLTTSPQDVIAGLSLSRSGSYNLTNAGGSPILLAESASAPDVDTLSSRPLRVGQAIAYSPHASENLYAWTHFAPANYPPRLVVDNV